eukprot:CAMPEP_0198600438 /NCGR_PEP_ID=MMETSP1462-20131121/148237_1 /TAXON_ID=1333877 /ORGANISM="Brandtodinium nutriculum, Strain RCC3387" /LENGTH=89 /DNA_ID=CAMNT_0044332149 /DNA_START=219 /DNA_END=488 /DNA_ORIENTATION=+
MLKETAWIGSSAAATTNAAAEKTPAGTQKMSTPTTANTPAMQNAVLAVHASPAKVLRTAFNKTKVANVLKIAHATITQPRTPRVLKTPE